MSSGSRASGTFTKALSDDLSASYANYVNSHNFKDENGNALTLETSSEGIFASGSYYNYLVKTVETSLNNFLSDTTFPYTPSNSGFPGGGRGGTHNADSTTMTTYNSASEYIASLNSTKNWINYDATSNTTTITSMRPFVQIIKNTTKDVGAFDSLTNSAAENDVFRDLNSDCRHFDSYMANLLSENSTKRI